jgi:hypothetical protein
MRGSALRPNLQLKASKRTLGTILGTAGRARREAARETVSAEPALSGFDINKNKKEIEK